MLKNFNYFFVIKFATKSAKLIKHSMLFFVNVLYQLISNNLQKQNRVLLMFTNTRLM